MVTFSLRSNVDATGLSNMYDNRQSTEPLALLKARWPAKQAALVVEIHLHGHHAFAHSPTVLTNPECCCRLHFFALQVMTRTI